MSATLSGVDVEATYSAVGDADVSIGASSLSCVGVEGEFPDALWALRAEEGVCCSMVVI